MTERHLERAIEWEAVSRPTVLENVVLPVPPFMPGVITTTITRDENLQLRLVADGVLREPGEVARRHAREAGIPPGTFYPSVDVSVEAFGSKLDLRMHLEHEPSSLQMSARESAFQQLGWIDRMRRTWSQKFVIKSDDDGGPGIGPLGDPSWRSDWYVNGATGFRFTKRTTRKQHASFKRKKEFHAVAIEEGPRGHVSRDHIVVDAGVVRFAYCEVPKEHAPEGLGAVSIDFVAPFPGAETRTAIGEIVSFALGRRMMLVGSTTFDATGWSIEEESVNPWGQSIRRLCSSSASPPVDYNYNGAALEVLLADLIPRYLVARDALGLKDALWSYWIANESPASIDLPIFASAVETLKKNWLSSTRSKSNGLHMPKANFEALAGDLIEELRRRVKERGAPEEIARTFSGANRMGLSAQMRAFFEEIDLPIGDRERAAMDARHRSAHGASGGEELTELVRLGNAYRTLFERVFLRVLGYEGMYVDRTTAGYPHRPLAEPPGGAQG
jgi:hypothetical protein